MTGAHGVAAAASAEAADATSQPLLTASASVSLLTRGSSTGKELDSLLALMTSLLESAFPYGMPRVGTACFAFICRAQQGKS